MGKHSLLIIEIIIVKRIAAPNSLLFVFLIFVCVPNNALLPLCSLKLCASSVKYRATVSSPSGSAGFCVHHIYSKCSVSLVILRERSGRLIPSGRRAKCNPARLGGEKKWLVFLDFRTVDPARGRRPSVHITERDLSEDTWRNNSFLRSFCFLQRSRVFLLARRRLRPPPHARPTDKMRFAVARTAPLCCESNGT